MNFNVSLIGRGGALLYREVVDANHDVFCQRYPGCRSAQKSQCVWQALISFRPSAFAHLVAQMGKASWDPWGLVTG